VKASRTKRERWGFDSRAEVASRATMASAAGGRVNGRWSSMHQRQKGGRVWSPV
jgi:hypothetical protein